MVKFAYHQGIDFIICDHHLPDEAIPQAVAVLDPKRPDCNYPFQELSGCGIGFKLIQGYARTHREEHEIFDYLDLVAVSIASDIVPINGENRVLSFYGLQKLNQNPRPGLKALRDISGIKADQDVSGVVFTLGPRINAAGRVDHGRAAVELLVAESEDEANEMAGRINSTNDLRREFDVNITEEAIAMIEGNESLRTAKSTVLFKNTWNKGVIGIVAARCVERYYRPTIILTESNERITGSARSVAGFNLYDAIEQCSDLLEKFGGHKYAAGLTLLPQNLAAFQKRFEEIVAATLTDDMRIPIVDIDLPIHLDLINPRFFNILKQMAPFGPENQKPVFESRSLQVANSLSSFKDKHMRFLVGQSGSDQIFTVMAFDLIEHYARLQNGDKFRMAYTVDENTFNGNTSIQLRAKDIKFD
jgi:single-stranded-DNA-specific exonuclease